MSGITVNPYDEIQPNDLKNLFDEVVTLNKREMDIAFVKWQYNNNKFLQSIRIIDGMIKLIVNEKQNDCRAATIAGIFYENNSSNYQQFCRYVDNFLKMGTSEDYSNIVIDTQFHDIYNACGVGSCMKGEGSRTDFYRKMNELAGYDMIQIAHIIENGYVQARCLVWNLIPPEVASVSIECKEVPEEWNGILFDRIYATDESYRNKIRKFANKNKSLYKEEDSIGWPTCISRNKKFNPSFKITFKNKNKRFIDLIKENIEKIPYFDSFGRMLNSNTTCFCHRDFMNNKTIHITQSVKNYISTCKICDRSELTFGNSGATFLQAYACEDCIEQRHFVCVKNGTKQFNGDELLNYITVPLFKLMNKYKVSLKYFHENGMLYTDSFTDKTDLIISNVKGKKLTLSSFLSGNAICQTCGKIFKGSVNICESCLREALSREEDVQQNIKLMEDDDDADKYIKELFKL